jgi:hypothetical protein
MAANKTISVFHKLREIAKVEPVQLSTCANKALEELGQHCEWEKLLCIIDIFGEYPASGKSRRWILDYLPDSEWTQKFINGSSIEITEAHILIAIQYHDINCKIH